MLVEYAVNYLVFLLLKIFFVFLFLAHLQLDIYSKETKQWRQIYTVENFDIRARKTPPLSVHGRAMVQVFHKNVQYFTKFTHDWYVVFPNNYS